MSLLLRFPMVSSSRGYKPTMLITWRHSETTVMRPRYLRPSLSLPDIYLYRPPIDFRKQANSLAALVELRAGA